MDAPMTGDKQQPSKEAMKAAKRMYRDLAWDTDEPEGMEAVARILETAVRRAHRAGRRTGRGVGDDSPVVNEDVADVLESLGGR